MKYLPYVLKHLGKNKIRTLSTVLGMAVCIFLVCVLQTMTEAMRQGLEAAAPDRLITRHSVSLVFNMPNAYGPKLARVPGVKAVAASNWFGGYFQDPKNFFTNFAVESETYFDDAPGVRRCPPDQMAEYMQRHARLHRRPRPPPNTYGWKIGDVIPLTSFIPPYQIGRPFEFTVRGIYDVGRAEASRRRPGDAVLPLQVPLREHRPARRRRHLLGADQRSGRSRRRSPRPSTPRSRTATCRRRPRARRRFSPASPRSAATSRCC